MICKTPRSYIHLHSTSKALHYVTVKLYIRTNTDELGTPGAEDSGLAPAREEANRYCETYSNNTESAAWTWSV